MAENLHQAQQRILLAQMAQAGSAATAEFQAGQAALQQQRQQALTASMGASSQAGGVNDVGALLGAPFFDQPLEVKRRIGYLPERVPLYEEMVVSAFLRYVAEIKGVPRGERRGHIEKR